MPSDNNAKRSMKLQCVVNGAPREVSVRSSVPLAQAMARIVRSAGMQGRPLEEWEARDREGRWLDPEQKPSELGLRDGDLLFVNLRAGVGA